MWRFWRVGVAALAYILAVRAGVHYAGGFGPVAELDCWSDTAALRPLLSLVCTRASNGSAIQNNCTACFLTALTADQGRTSLTQLSTCANVFLAGTNYSECATVLQADIQASSAPLTVKATVCQRQYCGFARCLRRINGDLLVSDCFAEAGRATNATNNATRVAFYKNVTSCLLARSRCDTANPITGQRQAAHFAATFVDKLGKPHAVPGPRVANALQVSAAGDVRVLAFPETAPTVRYLCYDGSPLNQATWPNATCQ